MFGDGFDRFFLGLLNTGFAASVVILIVLVLRLALRRAPKRYSYLLWAPALLRLLCPFSLESAFSLLPANPAPIPQDIALMATPQLDTGFVALNRVVNAALPAAQPQNSVNPMQIILLVGELIWLAGAAGLLLYAVISTLRLRRRLRAAVHEEENIYLLPGLETPFVMGLFRPKIYLPAGILWEERRYILLHERTHLRRGDHLIRLLAFFAVCLHWFNPLVWLAYHLSGRDMEMSCDEAVVQRMGERIKRPYSASLLALASGRRWVSGAPLAFGEGDTRPRIKNVLRYRKPAFWLGVLLAVLVVALGIGLALNPNEQEPGTSSSTAGQSGAQGAGEGSFARFTILAQDVADPGDHGLQLPLGDRQSQVLELLNPDAWRTPGEGELLEVGVSPVLTLLSEEGEVLDVCYWEDGQSLIMLHSIDGSEKEIYLAPGEVAQQASAFSEEFVAGAVSQEDWIRAILWTVTATPQSTSLIIPQGLNPDDALSIEISALIPREENGVPYTERVILLDERKSCAEWAAGSYCEGLFPYDYCPDGTELSVMLRFLEQEGDNWISSSWGYRSYRCEGGEMVEQVVPNNTAVTVLNESAESGTAVTLRYAETVGAGFSVRFTLPGGWTAEQTDSKADFTLAAPVNLIAPDGAVAGRIGYDLLGSETELYQEPENENQVFYYNTLMLGSAVNWNNEYQEVLREDGLVSATCRVGYQKGGAGGTTSYNWGILARDESLGRFIGMEIEDGALAQDAVEQIARSVRFFAGE